MKVANPWRPSVFGLLCLLGSIPTSVRADAPTALKPRVPPGFVIEPVATDPDVVFPMFACFDDRGRLFVAESSGLDLYAELKAQTRKCRVRLLEDPDPRTGRFRKARVWADKLVFPMGLTWHDGKLYVADPPDLVTLEDTDGDGKADRRRVILTGFGHLDNGSLHGLVFGPDGLLYMTMGSPDGYRLKRKDAPPLAGKSGALIRCRPDGSEPEVLSRGFVNLIEVVFTRRGEVLGTDNWFQKPTGGVRDALVHCVDGGLYPYEPDSGSPYPVTGEPLPAMALFPAVALSGLSVYEGTAFPTAMRGNLFAAQHNSRKVSRHVLVPQGTTFRTEDHDFVTSTDPDFHPADVLESGDGSLLVLDTGSWYVHHCPTGQIRKSNARGGIYRVRPEKWAPPEDPWGVRIDWSRSAKELAALLGDDRPSARNKARLTLAQRGCPAISVLREVLTESKNVRAKQQAIWALAQVDRADALPPLWDVLRGDVDDLVVPAARALGLRRDRGAAPALVRLLEAKSPAVQLAAAEALARCGDAEVLPDLWKVLRGANDRFLDHALIHAIHNLADASALRTALEDRHPSVQRAALLLLDQPPRAKGLLRAEEVRRRVVAADPGLRRTALRLLQCHPEWGDQAVDLLEGWLKKPALTDEEQLGLRSLVLAFQQHAPVQRLVADALRKDQRRPAAGRQVQLLQAVAESELAQLPPVWVDALATALKRDEKAVREQAVRTAAILQLPQLDEALNRLVEDRDEAAGLRLEALRAVVLRRPRPSAAAFTLLWEQLGEKADPLSRLAAAELLGRCQLSDEQMGQVLRAIHREPLISPSVLLPMLRRSITSESGPSVLDYLTQALRDGWRPGEAELGKWLDDLPSRLRMKTGTIRNFWKQNVEQQRVRLAQFEPLLAGGDAERGRRVFRGRKTACLSCHRVGSEGGPIGPDLTRIGAVRAGRDILE